MYRPLVPCSACRRHVLASSSSCPFCQVARTPSFEEAAPTFRASRAAAVAFAVAIAGCHSDPAPVEVHPDPAVSHKPPQAPTPGESSKPPPAPTPADSPKPPPKDAGLVDDHGGMVTKYGAPPRPPTPPKPKTPPAAAYGAPPF